MRWNTEIGKRYMVNEIRPRVKFLLLPKCIRGECRWFERAAWEERLEEYITMNTAGSLYERTHWVPRNWCEL